MIYYNKETRYEGVYYRKSDWGIERADDWDNGKNNFTNIAPPECAFDGVPVDWDEQTNSWVVDTHEYNLRMLEKSDQELLSKVARAIEDILSERIDNDKFVNDEIKDLIDQRISYRNNL